MKAGWGNKPCADAADNALHSLAHLVQPHRVLETLGAAVDFAGVLKHLKAQVLRLNCIHPVRAGNFDLAFSKCLGGKGFFFGLILCQFFTLLAHLLRGEFEVKQSFI